MLAYAVKGDVHRAVDVAARVLAGVAHVQQRDGAVARQGGDLIPVELLDYAGADVLYHEAAHVDGILRAAVGRGVAQLQLGQVGAGESRADGGGKDVYALVDSGGADYLRAEYPARVWRKEHLDQHVLRPGVVPGVVAPVADDALVGYAGGLGGLFVQTGAGGGEVKDLDDRGADGALVLAVDAADVVGGDAPLLVGNGPASGVSLSLPVSGSSTGTASPTA